MKFLFAISALGFLGSAVNAAVKPDNAFAAKMVNTKKFKLEHDFMQAIHSDGKIAHAQRKKREATRKRKLYEKLIEAAIPKEEHDAKRNLDQSEYDMGDSYEWMNPVYQQMVEDGVFDLTARSFKYSGCAAIKTFDSENAADGNFMTVDTYAVFRLCPEDSCNKYSLTGCGKNYGEYVVEMTTYLGFMLDFYEDHYGAYCDYCYSCDYNYQVMKKQMQGECYENMNQYNYDNAQQQQEYAWENYYQSNFGDMSAYMEQKSAYQQQMQDQMSSAYSQGQSSYYSAEGYSNGNTNNNNYNGGRKLVTGSPDMGWYHKVGGNVRRLDSSYYSNFASYSQGDGSSGSWQDGGQATGDSYYNMMNQQMQYQNGQPVYGYVDENGEFVNLCESEGYTDENGQEYDISCDMYESKMMVCSDGSLCDYCEYQVDLNFEPCDEYVCNDYYTYCSDLYEPNYKQMYSDENNGQNDDEENNNNGQYYNNNNGQYAYNSNYNYQDAQESKSELYQFLECTEYVNEYGEEYFVGPHCGSDHYTISLGVFSDENCVKYVGETVSLSKVLGYGYDDESFFHLPHECISCDGASQFQNDEQRYDEMYTGYGVYGQYVEAPNEEFDDIVGMCAALFERSAQCNIHMNNYGTMAKYMQETDAAFENRYCSFIDNIVYGSYDEMGEIKLKAETFDFANWKNPDQYKKVRMPAGQAVGLALSIVLVISLAAMAFVTQRSLTRRGTPWRPRRFRKSVEVAHGGAPNPTPPLI